MLRIVSHIENLLLSHDCVIVPSIGGFVTHYEEASFSEDGKEIYPPYCSVSFNSQLSDKEDKYGMLTQSYMTAYDINYPRALALVSEDIADMREQLRKNMELQIGTIGTLQLTLNYSLLFTPSAECGIFAKELYGLVQAAVKAVDSSKLAMRADNAVPAKPQTAEILPLKKEETTAESSVKRDNSDTHYIIRVSKNAVRYTATTIAAALLYFVFAIAPSVDSLTEVEIQEAAIINVPKPKKAKPAAPVTTKADDNAADDGSIDSKPCDEASRDNDEAYTLVVASAVSQKGAQALVEELIQDGFADAQIMTDNGMTRVIYSCYPTNEAANEAAKQMRQQHKRFQSVWVMRK